MIRLEVKICGVSADSELDALADAGVDYAGLWFDVPSGRHSLSRERLLALASGAPRGLRCVAVTTQSDPAAIAAFVQGARIAAVQAHGFLLPGAVTRLRRLLADDVEIFQVLHVRGGECLERSLLRAYAGAGADAFVVDNFVSRERIGSSGQGVPLATVGEIADVLGAHRVFLAGGVDEGRIRDVSARLALRGVDIDSAARAGDAIDRVRVGALVGAARSTSRGAEAHAR